MMHEEFMKLAGYEVSYKDYIEIIEPMYLAVDLSKEEFIKCIDKKRFALRSEKTVIKEMRKVANIIKDNCTHFIDHDNYEKLEALAKELMSRYRAVSYYIESTEKLYNNYYHSTCYYPCKITFYTFTGNKIIELSL